MRLRTFTAPSLAEAMNEVRRSLGEDAIIVSTHEAAGKVEVTAAIEGRRREPAPLLAPETGRSLDDILLERLQNSLREPEAQGERSLVKTSAPAAPAGARRVAPASPREAARHEPAETRHASFDSEELHRALSDHGTPPALTASLVRTASAMDADDPLSALALALETRFNFEPLAPLPQRPLLLIGMPGAGKTVTQIKLAARAMGEGAKITLITADAVRTGAALQSEAYGALLEAPVLKAETADELSDHLAGYREVASMHGARACLIDTASFNPFNAQESAEAAEMIAAARRGGKAEPVAVLSAAMDPVLTAEVAEEMAQLGARRVIFTQLDLARRMGGLLAAADASGLSLSQISISPYLGQGLARLDPVRLAQLVLGETGTSGSRKARSA